MLYMTPTRKRNTGIFSILPLIAFIITFIYESVLLGKLVSTRHIASHFAINSEISSHYSTLTMLYGISVVLTLVVLLYFVVHIALIKKMNAGRKIIWIVFLTAFMPVSFPFFWYMLIRREPLALETKPNIN